MRWVALVVVFELAASNALAQPAPETPAPAPEALAAPAVDPRNDAGWQLYHEAFRAMLRGERTKAAELAMTLQRDHASHPAVRLVVRVGLGSPAVTDEPRQQSGERPTSGARAELALFQTLNGIALGVELCIVAECQEEAAAVGMALVGGAVGAGASLLVLPEITPGQRGLLNSGTAWGAINAGLLLVAMDPEREQSFALGLMAGQLGGLTAGALLFTTRPTAGQVALANSGGQWAGILGGLAVLAIEDDLTDGQIATLLLIGVDAGIVGGATLGQFFPHVSRAQTLVIDAGGVVGVVGGGAAAVLLSGDTDSRSTPAGAALGGMLGLGAAAYLTRNWGDRSDAPGVHAIVRPVERGRGGVAGFAFTF